nr:myosin-2 heavy chain-like [Nicotiana tomentosiformis]
MANLFENPSSPPKETTLTPSITPSPTPTSKKGRFKMIARKVVVGGEQIKKINEQLKASRAEEPQKFEESFKCATEGEETVSYKIEQVTSSQKITSETISEVAEKLENSLVLVGTMAGVETTESGKLGGKNKKKKEKESEGTQGYVRGMGKGVAKSSPTPVGLTEETRAMVVSSEESAGEEERKNIQELVPYVKEPLEDLLKRVSDSYNPKQKKSLGVKILGTVRANKKRKAASSIPVETPPTRGRDTRSQKKQSEAELEKALEDSKRKVASKGKKKMVEHVEAVEIEEMDLVLRDEDKEEVATPKTKKRKTSKKKSPSKTKSAEPSTLVKRTKSVVKSRK